jgi:hypothetical protein
MYLNTYSTIELIAIKYIGYYLNIIKKLLPIYF